MNSLPAVYLAAPLFSEAELGFNRAVREALLGFASVFLPQEDGQLLTRLVASGTKQSIASELIFQADLTAIDRCDVFIAVLDGRSVDEGVAFELGYAFAKGKRCIGLQTDVRRLLYNANNPMVEGSLSRIFLSLAELSGWFQAEFSKPERAGVGEPSGMESA